MKLTTQLPKGKKFKDAKSGRRMLILMDNTNAFDQWLFYRSLRKRWIPFRRATSRDLKVLGMQ